MKKNNYIWLAVFLVLFISRAGISQCVIIGNYQFVDDGEISININVNGLTQPNLTDPGQGLCGVRVRFTHELIGDVLLRLRSPSGQEIELTGPQVVTSATSFSVFDITFIPCTQAPAPDPGFAGQWNNNQPWGILGNYSGSYHPYSGCLENLTGSAVGLWTLTAIDAQGQDIGVIEEVELIFCNPTGLLCIECEANGGILSEADTFQQCVNEAGPDLNLSPTFEGSIPDDSRYGYFYILSYQDEIIEVSSHINPTGLDTGLYVICGISILHADSNTIKSFPSGLLLSGYENYLLNTGICFELSSECSYLLVKPELPPFFRSVAICQGDTFSWWGEDYWQEGNYFRRARGLNGCLRDHNLALTVLNPQPAIQVVVPFGCHQDTATLSGSDATYGLNADFLWYSLDGNIITDPTMPVIDVVGSGTYHLVTRKVSGMVGNCADTVSVLLTDDFREPQISYIGSTISCHVDSSNVRSFSNLAGVITIWRDQAGTEDTVKDHVVHWGELYTVIAVSPQGCRDSVEVVLPL